MSFLLIIGVVIGTLIFAWLFDNFWAWVFRDNVPAKDDIQNIVYLSKKVDRKLARQERWWRIKSSFKALFSLFKK